ncbi:MAG: response regulator transcription factor [Myxococcales bacterium]|nr:response regulator transcription factor [Myxococcales bacterium]
MPFQSGEHVRRLPLLELRSDDRDAALEQAILALDSRGLGDWRLLVQRADGKSTVPDTDGVIVVDGGDGRWAVEQAAGLVSAGYTGLIVGVTVAPRAEVTMDGYAAGAHLWEVPPIDTTMLAARIHGVLRRSWSDVDPEEISVSVDLNARAVTIGGHRARMSRRQFAIFLYLLERRERWVPATEILEHVFDTNHDSSTALVRVHVLNARKSLGPDYAWILQSEEGHGYRVTLRGDSTPARLKLPFLRRGSR